MANSEGYEVTNYNQVFCCTYVRIIRMYYQLSH